MEHVVLLYLEQDVMNAPPLYSPYWYRVAPLIPRMQPGTSVRRQVLRGKEWFILSHPVSGRHYRVNRQAYELVGRLDGSHSLETLWRGLERVREDDLPTQDELIRLVSRLANAGLLVFNTVPDWKLLNQQRKVQQGQERRAMLNPFSFRVRLLNPARMLERLAFLQPCLWRLPTSLLVLAVVVWGALHAVSEWNEIRAYATLHLTTSRSLLLAWLIYPFMKMLHELSHALAVRRWGGNVSEAGIGIFLLTPVPYVDASDASAFSSKWQRVAVSAAGIAVELLLAAAALYIWMIVENGIVRDGAFVVMCIGGLSTLAFNANPLMRFDGYYILCDLIESPNLAARSQQWWTHRLLRIAGQTPVQALHAEGSERAWLVLYTPLSWIYRLFLSMAIVKWITAKSLLLGLTVAGWMLYTLLAQPLWRTARLACGGGTSGSRQLMRTAAMALAAMAVVAAAFTVPLPVHTLADGVVWLPEKSQVRAGADGRIVQILARDGQYVTRGQALVVTEDPVLLAKRARVQAGLAVAEAGQAAGWSTDPMKGRNALEDTERLRKDLAELDEQIERLILRADVEGIFVLPNQNDIAGLDIAKGMLIAYVLAIDEPVTVRAAIAQDDIGQIKAGVRTVSVRLAESEGKHFDARVLRIDPAAVNRLPSVALGDKGGGAFITDPADRDGLALLEPVFLADVGLMDRAVFRTGGHAWVRFEHEPAPLGEIALQRLRQLFLRVFTVEGK